MRLLIVRHAIAVPRGTAGIADDERPLTDRGVERFRAAAAGLARIIGPPDILLSSPLERARETARIASAAWGGVEVREIGCLAGGAIDDLFSELLLLDPGSCVAVFGHEPHLSDLLARLLGSRRSDGLEFKKGGAALVEFEGDPNGGGRLVWFLPPKILRRLAE